MSKVRVVVTGLGIVSGFGNDLDLFYDNLLEGKCAIKKIDKFNTDKFNTKIAAPVKDYDSSEFIDKKQDRRIDPFLRFAISAGSLAVEDSGLNLDSINKYRAGVLVGSGMGGMEVFYNTMKNLYENNPKKVSPFFIPYIIPNMAGAMISKKFGFMGPNYSISTACATGNFCIKSAADHIMNDEADIMICGGAEGGVNEVSLSGFEACKAISRRNDSPETSSRPWDKNRDGFVIGEGSGVLILEKLEHALERGAKIYAEYIGGAFSCDAYHITEPMPDGTGMALSMTNALKNANLLPDDVTYINAHATSTYAGDIVELKAIKKVFNRDIKVNATKSMLGHSLGAAGGIEAIAAIKSIERQEIHPTINVSDPIEELSFVNPILDTSCKCNVEVVMSNSFGFGGHNSSTIFKKYK